MSNHAVSNTQPLLTMRPKIIIGVLLLAFGLLGGIALVSSVLRSEPSGPPARIAVSPPPTSPANEPRIVRHAVPKMTADAPPRDMNMADLAQLARNPADAAYIQRRIDELNDLAMEDDPVAHGAILAELTNPEKEIRQAALECLIQAHDQMAVPRLRELLGITADPAEQTALRAAIKSINLPSLTDYVAEDG